MAENTYNYDNQTLSSPGTAENLVREGKINDPELKHQPRTKKREPIPSSLSIVDLPESQVIKDFDKRLAVIYEELNEYGREFVTYEGKWYIEFLKGYETQANEWKKNQFAIGENTFKEFERKGRMLFELDNEDSQAKLSERSLVLDVLRKNYNDAEDITPYFKDMDHKIGTDKVEYFLLNDLEQFDTDNQLAHDYKYFNNDYSNMARVYIGGSLTNDDIGFYYDNGLRLRATYDRHFLYRSRPLIEDLLQYGQPDQYVVGYYRNGMVQFVIDPDLVKTLINIYGTEDTLAMRWNDVNTNPKNFKMGNYPTFEDTLDVKTCQYVSSDSIFEYTTEDEKKPTTNT